MVLNTRLEIVKIALSMDGDSSYKQSFWSGGLAGGPRWWGDYKCNLFADNVIKEADKNFSPVRAYMAGEWADINLSIDLFEVVLTPRPGDYYSFPLPSAGASGHVGIIVNSTIGSELSISASPDGVRTSTTSGFTANNLTYRRYIGPRR